MFNKNNMYMPIEKTLSIFKPDIIQKNLIGEIINIFEKKKLKIVAIKMLRLSPQQTEEFYEEHKNKPFFKSMVKFMCGSPVVVICLEGENAIKLNREIMGATNPLEAKVGTIRRSYGESIDNNAVHGSDSPESAEREISFFFKKEEIEEIFSRQ
jgi:nucleoside-diphosphate kinase